MSDRWAEVYVMTACQSNMPLGYGDSTAWLQSDINLWVKGQTFFLNFDNMSLKDNYVSYYAMLHFGCIIVTGL